MRAFKFQSTQKRRKAIEFYKSHINTINDEKATDQSYPAASYLERPGIYNDTSFADISVVFNELSSKRDKKGETSRGTIRLCTESPIFPHNKDTLVDDESKNEDMENADRISEKKDMPECHLVSEEERASSVEPTDVKTLIAVDIHTGTSEAKRR